MRRRRFTLRTWMVLVVAWGVFLGWVRLQGSWTYALMMASHSYIAWALSFVAAFAVAGKLGPTVRGPVGRAMVSVLLALALAATLYLAWAYRRCWYFVYGLDHGFPYPDPGIIALERWFDARRPVSPGDLKLHGEYHTVAFVLGTMVLILAGVAGGLSGLLSDRGGEEGMMIRRLFGMGARLGGVAVGESRRVPDRSQTRRGAGEGSCQDTSDSGRSSSR